MAWKNRGKAAVCAAVLACSGTVAHAAGWTYVDPRTFTEDATGLMWDQCSAHSRTEFCVAGSIEGYDSYKKFSPDEALSWATKSNTDGHYGYSDWCVPNFSTLKNLYTNTQNSFPGYPGMGWLMTSTPAPVGAYQVITNRTAYGNSSEYVRLVRSTVYFGPTAACDVRVSAAIPTLGTTTSNLVVSLTNGGRGIGYWLGVIDRKRVPTAAEVRAGLDYDPAEGGGVIGGSAPVSAGSAATNISVPRFSGVAVPFNIHHMYFVMEDSQGNLSSVVGPIANSSLLIQSINFDTPSDTREGTDVVLRATASSGNTVNLTSATPAVCSVNAGIARALQSGVCTVNAKVPNDGIYSAAPKVSRSFTFLPKTAQNISFAAAPALQVGAASATLGATGGASGNPVTFSTSSAACSLSGSNNSTVTALAAGNCTVQADQAGDANYNAASPATQTITVGKGSQSIGFGAAPALQVGAASATLNATGGATGNAVTFSTSSAACSLSGANNSTVKGVSAGSCLIQANQAGDANYNAASAATQTITVGKGSQSIGFGAAPALQVGATGTLSATGGGSVSPVTFSTSSAACSLSGANNSTVKGVAAGSCLLQADQAGDANYNAASPATQTLTVSKGDQSIGFGAAPALQVGGATATLSATGGATGNAVTFSTSSTACGLSGSNNSTVTALAAGNCTVQADQAGDANYNAAGPATQTLTVSKGDQSIGFGAAPALQVGGATATLSATGGASGNAVTFSTSSVACSLSGSNNSVVKGVAAGDCTVQANQMGDANYNAASPATQTIPVGKGVQSIGFGVPPALQVAATITLSATGGASGNPVTFSTSSTACSLSGSNNSVVKGVAVGSCTLQADQVGDANYDAASQATQTITVGKGVQNISFGAAPALQVGGATATLSATGGATGNAVTFSTSSAACSLSGSNNSVVKARVAGSCTVQADQVGDANYNAASPATQTVTVAPATPGSPSYTGSTPAIAATNFSPAVAAGTAQVTISGGTDAGCGFVSAQFVAPLGISGSLPLGYQAAAAGFQFSSSYCGDAASIQIAITYPQALPANMVLYKWGPAVVGAPPSWFAYPGVTVSADRKTLLYSITDGGVGDANPADGYISDPVFVAVPNALPVPVPGLGVWALLMLSSGLLLLGLRRSRATA